MRLTHFAPLLALAMTLAGFSSAFAAGKPDHPDHPDHPSPPALKENHALVVHLTGASPTLTVGAPTMPNALGDYEYTNHGDGTVAGVLPVQWQYDEKGSIMTPTDSVIHAAEYDLEPKARPNLKVALHVIPSTYKIHYDNPTTAPCSTGSFAYRFKEGAHAEGTFAPLVTPQGCMPTYSLDVTIEANGQADRDLRNSL
jgi:hypothetical protein